MSSYTMDHKINMVHVGACIDKNSQGAWVNENSQEAQNIAILWVFLIKQLSHLCLLDMR